MDNAESGYYLSLDSCPEMYRKKDKNAKEEPEPASELQNAPDAERERLSEASESSDVFMESVNELYSLNKGKSKIYKEFFNLYSEGAEDSAFEAQAPVARSFSSESEKGFGLRSKLFLWLMIALLLSNPILGCINLYHFYHFDPLDTSPHESYLDPDVDYYNPLTSPYHNYQEYVAYKERQKAKEALGGSKPARKSARRRKKVKRRGRFDGLDDYDDYPRVTSIYNDPKYVKKNPDYFDWELADKEAEERERKLTAGLWGRVSRFVVKYSFVETFGELIFGLFSLLLLSLCKLPCNNKNSIRFMVPTLFMCYMIIYRLLAFYVLWATLKVLVVFALVLSLEHGCTRLHSLVLAFTPRLLLDLGELLEGLPGDATQAEALNVLRKLFQADRGSVYLLVVYCLENVCITFNECLELFSFLAKQLLAQVNRRILRRKELKFYQSAESGGRGRLLRNCFRRDFFQSSDPHEKYVHSLYNYASDIGTYLKNVEIRDYSANLDRLTSKFKSKKLSQPNPNGD